MDSLLARSIRPVARLEADEGRRRPKASWPPACQATYFTTPRPVYELYDLEEDPSELNNLSGKPEVAAVERELRLALAEKMILDFDYLPLPPRCSSTLPRPRRKPKGRKQR